MIKRIICSVGKTKKNYEFLKRGAVLSAFPLSAKTFHLYYLKNLTEDALFMADENKIQEIKKLVEHFQKDYSYFKSDGYNETLLRSEFLDPMFELLGWDIKNSQGRTTNEREVLLEESLKTHIDPNRKKPDYTFRFYSERKFFLEAKKPSIRIEEQDKAAIQARRYGYSAGLKISVLSNFEYLYIYDASIPVSESDKRTKALVKSYHFSEYEQKFDEISSLLGRESVYNGDFDTCWKEIENNVEHKPIDQLFVEQINSWRLELGNEILRAMPSLSLQELTDSVQSYINKILFLRVCEDRNLEPYQELLSIAKKDDPSKLIALFKQADRKYNSGLFDALLAPAIIGNISSTFWKIVQELYYPETPYSFAVLSSDVLGRIYEIFLVKQFSFVDGRLTLTNKPEHVDKDVVTTPTYIIQEILRRTVVPMIKKKDFKSLCKLKFADIACGSGAFLLELFQLLNDIMIDYLLQHDPSKLIPEGMGNYRLPFELKTEILTNCIYGIDKDFNATEATKFGLLLKLLEGENTTSTKATKPILPDLSKNIIFGNSLLSPMDCPNLSVPESVNAISL